MADEVAPGITYQNQLHDAGFSPDEVDSWKGQTAQQLSDGGFSDKEVAEYFGHSEPDTSAMKDYVKTGVKNFQDAKQNTESEGNPVPQHYAKTFLEHIQAGFQDTGVGMLYRKGLPDIINNPQDGIVDQLGGMLGRMGGDAIPYIVGSAIGKPLGAAAATALAPELPGAAQVAGGAIVSQMGGFALPAAMRRILADHYQKGDITDWNDFKDRFLQTTWEAAKGAMTGGASAITGGLAGGVAGAAIGPVAGQAAKFGTEATVMAAVSKGLEGQMFDYKDVLSNALLIGGVHAAGYGISEAPLLPKKMLNIFANTGERPEEIQAAAEKDPVLKQELLSENPDLPIQAKDSRNADQTSAADVSQEKPPQAPERTEAEQNILNNIVSRPEIEKPTLKDQLAPDQLRQKFIDDLDPLKIDRETPIAADKDPYILSRNYRGALGIAERALKFGTTDFKTGEQNGEGFQQILDRVPEGDVDGLNAYLAARRAKELNSRGIETAAFKPEDIESALESGKRFAGVAKDITDFRNRVKQYVVDAGLLSEKKSKMFDDMNENYVPFNYLQDVDPMTGERAKPGSASFFRIKGQADEEAKLLNPIESIMRDTPTLIMKAERNRVMQAFAADPDMQDFHKFVSEPSKPIQVTPDEITKGLEKQGVDTTDMNPDFLTIFRAQDKQFADNEVPVWYEGKMKVLSIDPDIAPAIKAMGYEPVQTGLFGKLMRGFANTLRAGTVLNPGFMVRHFMRSQIIGAVQGEKPLGSLIDAFKSEDTSRIGEGGIFGAIGDILHQTENFQKFMSSGGYNDGLNGIQHLFDQKPWELDKETGMISQNWNVIKDRANVLKLAKYVASVSDLVARQKEFNDVNGENASDRQKTTEAAFSARNVTIDNTRIGSEVREKLAPIIPFMNVGIQGTARTLEALKENPKQYIASALATITVPSILTYFHNQNDSRVKDAPQWEKDLYWMWGTDKWESARSQADALARPADLRRQDQDGNWEVNNGAVFKIPKPFEAGVLFGSLAERLLSKFVEGNPDAMKGFAQTVAHGVMPNIMSPAMTAPLEQAANYSFFTGNPIVSSQKAKELPQYQYSPWTSETAKKIGSVISAIPLIRDIGGKDTKLASPEVIDNYIQDLTGTNGRYITNALDAGLRATGMVDSPTKPAWTVNDVPFVKEFTVRNPTMKSQQIEDFYSDFDRASKLYATVTDLAKSGDTKAALDLQRQNPQDMERLTSIQQGISAANKMIMKIYENRDMSKSDKRQSIDTLTYQAIEMAKYGNQTMKDFRKTVNSNQGE